MRIKKKWVIAALVCIVCAWAGGTVYLFTSPSNYGTAPEQAYNSIVPQVQNAVTAYMVGHDGELPPTEGTSTAVNISAPPGSFVEKAEVLDICSLVREKEDYLRTVPDGCMGDSGDAGTNFYTGNCTRISEEDGHYVFFMDAVGNVYTGCDCNENGRIEEDGKENVSAYSGNCSPDSAAGDDVWLYKEPGWWDTYGNLFAFVFTPIFLMIYFVFMYFIFSKKGAVPKDDDSGVNRG